MNNGIRNLAILYESLIVKVKTTDIEILQFQQALISIDPARARDDPIIVKNVPYYKAKKTLEAEVMKLDPPPRPKNWGVSTF